MEGNVEKIAERLRTRYTAALEEWKETQGATDPQSSDRRLSRAFVPIPSRKRALSASSPADLDPKPIDWHALLRTVFRRFAGHLEVQGKLLNQSQLEVHRFRRIGETVAIAVPPRSTKFVVTCEDAPASDIGSVCCAITVPHSPRASVEEMARSACVVRVESRAAWSPSTTSDRLLDSVKSVFGFDAREFAIVAHTDRSRHRLAGADSDSDEEGDREMIGNAGVNIFISSHQATMELGHVDRMLDAYQLAQPDCWLSILKPARSVSQEWTYVSLGIQQKRAWSRERVARGDALRSKDRFKDALAEYTSAINLEETNADALLKRGELYLMLRQFEDAVRDFESVVRHHPSEEAARRGLLKAKGRLGHAERVVSHTERVRSRSKSPGKSIPFRTTQPEQPSTGDDVEQLEAAEVTGACDLARLETEKLKKLLEAEDRARRRKREHRDNSSDDSSSDSDSEDDDDGRDRHRRKRKKSSKKKKSKKSSKKSKSSRERKSSRRSNRERRSRSRSRSRSVRSSDHKDLSTRRYRSRSRCRSRDRKRSRRSPSSSHDPIERGEQML